MVNVIWDTDTVEIYVGTKRIASHPRYGLGNYSAEDEHMPEKNDLIILDDWGLQPMDTNTRLALLQILEERYDRKSVIIASQLPLNKWYDYIGGPTLADAILDRLVANANKIELRGDFMRQKKKK